MKAPAAEISSLLNTPGDVPLVHKGYNIHFFAVPHSFGEGALIPIHDLVWNLHSANPLPLDMRVVLVPADSLDAFGFILDYMYTGVRQVMKLMPSIWVVQHKARESLQSTRNATELIIRTGAEIQLSDSILYIAIREFQGFLLEPDEWAELYVVSLIHIV